MHKHEYNTTIIWTGNRGEGTTGYQSYDRNHIIRVPGKPDIPASSDSAYRGDASRYNPEEMLVAALSACHMLWYLHLCAVTGVVVVEYRDNASGIMIEEEDGGGRFKSVTLHPQVTVHDMTMIEQAVRLHAEANKKCFIANSCNFPVLHEPVIKAVVSH